MTNLREALTEQWGQRGRAPPMVRRLLVDPLALIGLGLALVVSFGRPGWRPGFAGPCWSSSASTSRLGPVLLGLLGVVLASPPTG